ncbi:MAG: hypothetical protein Q4A65_08330 [Bacillota bacterium]|nr:hypothetical protein [Bacillota bacterium]
MKKGFLRRQKEYSTETLIDVDYKPEDVMDYDSGKAPVTRNTQQAERLDDLVEFQKHARGHDDQRDTHNYNVLNAVRDYDPDAERRKAEVDPVREAAYDAEREADYDPDYGQDYDLDYGLDDVNDQTENDGFYDFENELASGFEPRPLRPDDAGYEDIMEQFTAAPTKPKYWFEEFGDYWSCSCGHLNKGDYCTNCGLTRELLRSLFILHKPGEEPGKYEGMPVKYEEVEVIVPKGRLSSKQKMSIAIAIIGILLICGGLFSYFYMILPAMEKEAAENVKTTGDALQSGIQECVEETDNFFLNSYITAGDACMDDKHYESAISYYNKALQIDSTSEIKDMITEAKYQYVKSKKKDGGDKFERYLGELMGLEYKDVADIYKEYYAWHFKIVTNLSPEDYSTDLETASRADTIYFHVTVSGGPPESSINVYYDATWPNGNKSTDMIGSNWTDGSKGTARLSYPVPMFLKEGTLKFSIYDKNSQELLGSDSINLKH